MGPWFDRSGRLSVLRIAVLCGLAAPAAWIAAGLAFGTLGAEPVKGALHLAGLWAIRLLFVTFAISPLSAAMGWTRLFDVRRMIGVAAFAYAAAHFALFAVDQKLDLAKVASEIVLRFYLAIGFAALVGLAALAATSSDRAVRAMGRNWQRLHRAAYGIGLLAAVHFFIQSKANVAEPLMMLGFYVWLMAARLPLFDRSRGRAARRRAAGLLRFAAAGAGAVALTALAEAGWFAFKFGAAGLRVLPTNLTGEAGTRPAWGVALALGLVLAVKAAQWLRGRSPGPPTRTKDGAADRIGAA
ncbi:MAG: ferric reductase-like transmembrane domain-containing protein [Alphaproteobacteria bacterium]|nr:ferric reductase-like transmembrane domain-containing protein [Alphaproteobacteria bacterium]